LLLSRCQDHLVKFREYTYQKKYESKQVPKKRRFDEERNNKATGLMIECRGYAHARTREQKERFSLSKKAKWKLQHVLLVMHSVQQKSDAVKKEKFSQGVASGETTLQCSRCGAAKPRGDFTRPSETLKEHMGCSKSAMLAA
jgi:hypothetical protein